MKYTDHYIQYQNNTIRIRRISHSEQVTKTPTLVFLHDALGCIESWNDFPKQLCKALKMNGLIYDRLGHGKSDVSQDTRPLDYLEREALEVLPQVLEATNIDRPLLVGSSDGGSIALIYGSHHNHVEAIISIAAHIKVEDITVEGVKETFVKLSSTSAIQKLEALHGDKTLRLIHDWADIWLSPNFKRWNMTSQLKNITCPTIVLQGENDLYATPQHAQDIANAIGENAICKFIVESGHFPYLEKPEIVTQIIKDFISN